jgi:hypothetical protein
MTGKVSNDYKSLLYKTSKVEEKKNEVVGKRFKVIVEGGQIYVQCIDSFEDVFEISKDVVEGLELTQILDPYLFENHRDIINALFEVYYELSNQYIQTKAEKVPTLYERAQEKLRLKFGLDEK